MENPADRVVVANCGNHALFQRLPKQFPGILRREQDAAESESTTLDERGRYAQQTWLVGLVEIQTAGVITWQNPKTVEVSMGGVETFLQSSRKGDVGLGDDTESTRARAKATQLAARSFSGRRYAHQDEACRGHQGEAEQAAAEITSTVAGRQGCHDRAWANRIATLCGASPGGESGSAAYKQ